jgi:hypothetical protein
LRPTKGNGLAGNLKEVELRTRVFLFTTIGISRPSGFHGFQSRRLVGATEGDLAQNSDLLVPFTDRDVEVGDAAALGGELA